MIKLRVPVRMLFSLSTIVRTPVIGSRTSLFTFFTAKSELSENAIPLSDIPSKRLTTAGIKNISSITPMENARSNAIVALSDSYVTATKGNANILIASTIRSF
jgi:hypothetical protein